MQLLSRHPAREEKNKANMSPCMSTASTTSKLPSTKQKRTQKNLEQTAGKKKPLKKMEGDIKCHPT